MFTKFFVDACVAIMLCASAGQNTLPPVKQDISFAKGSNCKTRFSSVVKKGSIIAESENAATYDKYITQCLANLLYEAMELGIPCWEQ